MVKLVLIEGLRKYDYVDEARVLATALRLMTRAYTKRRSKSLRIIPHIAANKKDFLEWLEKDTDFLHISAHGGIEEGHSYLKITAGGKVTARDIENLDIKAKCLFLNACQTARDDMANAFFKANKHRKKMYFISTKARVPFDEAFLVALLFYKKAFVERKASLLWALKYTESLKDIQSEYWFWSK
jgi:hypothetical protein